MGRKRNEGAIRQPNGQISRRRKPVMRVCAVFDTETTTLVNGRDSRAFPVLYQVNDMRAVPDFKFYEPGKSDDIRLFRTCAEMESYLGELMAWGAANKTVPVVTAYNLMFDIASIRMWVAAFPTFTLAQSSMAPYFIDIVDVAGNVRLRFWDCMRLQMGGLAQMGKMAGLPKAKGDWDYSKVRTPDTPLSDEEAFYASRDVQVIPAYFRFLLLSNEWLKSEELGSRVLTATGLVRMYARRVLGRLPSLKAGETLDDYMAMSKEERPRRKRIQSVYEQWYADENKPYSFECYGARHAAFRGGWSFTSARWAGVVVRNVVSLDVTSMHHTFFSQDVPYAFKPCAASAGMAVLRSVAATSLGAVLKAYHRPFSVAFHAHVRLVNVRPKKGAATSFYGVGLLAQGKFGGRSYTYADDVVNDGVEASDAAMRMAGYTDTAVKPVWAFGKLMAAESVDVWVSEIEFWNICHVYDFDSVEWLWGEVSRRFKVAPAYVVMQSMTLYTMKNDVKRLTKTYVPGRPYEGDIAASVPGGIKAALRDGSYSAQELDSYYHYVKGLFNGVYGVQAMDEYKPDHFFNGDIHVQEDTIVTSDNFVERTPENSKVMYTYGLRIVGRSRMHLLIAMMLIFNAWGERARVTGGDTDSLKVSLDDGLKGADLLPCLQPLHDAADEILAHGYSRLSAEYGAAYTDDMAGVGHFDVEACNEGKTAFAYPLHIELWTKCRVSFDVDGHCHVTCAGVSQPKGVYTIAMWYEDAAKAHGAEWALTHGMGWNAVLSPDLSHILGRVVPAPEDVFDADVRDYMGCVSRVHAPMVQALYPSEKSVADTRVKSNAASVRFLKKTYGRSPDVSPRVLSASDWRQ